MKTILKIEGIYCAGCARSVERALDEVEAVKEVQAGHVVGQAAIDHKAA